MSDPANYSSYHHASEVTSEDVVLFYDKDNGRTAWASWDDVTSGLGGSAHPSGSDTELQYRNGTSLGAIVGSSWDGITLGLPRIEPKSINANATAGTHHTLTASGASYTDNVLNLHNSTGGYSSATGTHPSDSIGTGRAWALGIGPNGSGHAYYNTIYLASNPSAADVTGPPPDILISQERQDGAPANQHARIFFDGTNKKVTAYGWSTSAAFGPVGWSVDSAGKVSIGTVSPGEATFQVGSTIPVSIGLDWKAYFGSSGLTRVGIDGGAGSGLELIESGVRQWVIGSTSGVLGFYSSVGGAYAVQIDPTTSHVAATVGYRVGGTSGPLWVSGSGSPEGVVTAPVGSIYSRINGGAGTTLYTKESGIGNTGWVAK